MPEFQYRLDAAGKVISATDPATGRLVLDMRDPPQAPTGAVRSSADLLARLSAVAMGGQRQDSARPTSAAALRASLGMQRPTGPRRPAAPAAAPAGAPAAGRTMREDAPAAPAPMRSAAAVRAAGRATSGAELRARIGSAGAWR